MQTSTTAPRNEQGKESVVEPRIGVNDHQSRALLNQALLDAIAWNARSHARRKRLGLR